MIERASCFFLSKWLTIISVYKIKYYGLGSPDFIFFNHYVEVNMYYSNIKLSI